MRLLSLLFVLSLFSLQAHAQPAPSPAGPAPSAASAPAAKAHAASKPHRMTWEQRFAAANTTHDGHLTMQQAEAGYSTVARHFHEIDTGKKGYVTEEDITDWHKRVRAMHHSHEGHAAQTQSSMQQGAMQPRQINASAAVSK